jgi:hypothetical protein
VGWFRREALHEKLAREGGLEQPQPFEPRPARPFIGAFHAAGLTGIARSREWDAVMLTEAAGLSGNEIEFVTLPDGSVIVEREDGDAEVDPLATALEERLDRPYHALAVRKLDDLWAVSGRRIEIAELEADGDEIELTRTEEGTTLTVDGERAFGTVPALETLGERQGDAFVVHARRLEENLWEIRSAAL